jgi:hypothetical protein
MGPIPRGWSSKVLGRSRLVTLICIFPTLLLIGDPARAVSCLGANLAYAETGNLGTSFGLCSSWGRCQQPVGVVLLQCVELRSPQRKLRHDRLRGCHVPRQPSERSQPFWLRVQLRRGRPHEFLEQLRRFLWHFRGRHRAGHRTGDRVGERFVREPGCRAIHAHPDFMSHVPILPPGLSALGLHQDHPDTA